MLSLYFPRLTTPRRLLPQRSHSPSGPNLLKFWRLSALASVQSPPRTLIQVSHRITQPIASHASAQYNSHTKFVNMAATSTMHPLAMRSSGAGNGHTSTVQRASQAASEQLRSSTCQAAKESAALTAHIPSTRSPRPSSKVSKSHVHGLRHVEEYPSHPSNPEIKVLSAAQYYSLQAQESVLETPESVLFPWLHGADQRGTQQAYYFGYGSGGLKTPRYVNV